MKIIGLVLVALGTYFFYETRRPMRCDQKGALIGVKFLFFLFSVILFAFGGAFLAPEFYETFGVGMILVVTGIVFAFLGGGLLFMKKSESHNKMWMICAGAGFAAITVGLMAKAIILLNISPF